MERNKYIVQYREIMMGSDNFSKIEMKLLILKDVLCSKLEKGKTAYKYGVSRNTVTNILRQFRNDVSADMQKAIIANRSFSKEELLENLSVLLPKSRKPLSHSRCANEKQESLVEEIHNKLGYGYGALATHIRRAINGSDRQIVKDYTILKDLTEAQIKGIYKRKQLNCNQRKF